MGKSFRKKDPNIFACKLTQSVHLHSQNQRSITDFGSLIDACKCTQSDNGNTLAVYKSFSKQISF